MTTIYKNKNDIKKIRRAGRLAALVAVIAAWVALGLAGCSAEQAKARCQAVPDSQSWMNFVGYYGLPTTLTGTCTEVTMPLGESLYLFTFNPAGDDKLNSQGIKSGPMGDAISAAVEAGALDSAAGLAIHHASVAVGKYATENPNSDGICTAFSFSSAVTDLPPYTIEEEDTESDSDTETDTETDSDSDTDTDSGDDDDDGDEVPALVQTYEWSNFRVYIVPNQIGMQFDADLRLTINGCTGTFHVQAAVPEIDCGATDANGEPIVDVNGVQTPDNTICTNKDKLINNIANPDMALKCVNLSTDPASASYRCVPAKPFPSNI
jgi:hypothetical protein